MLFWWRQQWPSSPLSVANGPLEIHIFTLNISPFIYILVFKHIITIWYIFQKSHNCLWPMAHWKYMNMNIWIYSHSTYLCSYIFFIHIFTVINIIHRSLDMAFLCPIVRCQDLGNTAHRLHIHIYSYSTNISFHMYINVCLQGLLNCLWPMARWLTSSNSKWFLKQLFQIKLLWANMSR